MLRTTSRDGRCCLGTYTRPTGRPSAENLNDSARGKRRTRDFVDPSFVFMAFQHHMPTTPPYRAFCRDPAVLRELYSYTRISRRWPKKWPFKHSRAVARVVSEVSKIIGFPPDVILSLAFHDTSLYPHIYRSSSPGSV